MTNRDHHDSDASDLLTGYILLASLVLGMWMACVSGCIRDATAKGVDLSKPQRVEVATAIEGDGNTWTNVTLQIGEFAPWVACGLFGLASLRGRQYRLATDRLVDGVELCGKGCIAKEHAKAHHDGIERVINKRVKKLTKRH